MVGRVGFSVTGGFGGFVLTGDVVSFAFPVDGNAVVVTAELVCCDAGGVGRGEGVVSRWL